MKASKFLIFIFSICAVIWLYELGNLFIIENYQMNWFDQVMSAFTSVLAMITWLFQELDQ